MNQNGFAQMIVIAIIAAVLLGAAGYFYATYERTPRTATIKEPADGLLPAPPPPSLPALDQHTREAKKTGEVTARDDTKKPPAQSSTQPASQIGYRDSLLSSGKTPCPAPFIFDLPIDLGKATSVLYPGQIRGGDYKAHGGFRFDTSRPEEITVVAPIDAPVVTGARYPVNGEIQYTLEFGHPCGIHYRLGHLLTLTPKFQAIAEQFPLPTTLDSRTTEVYPPIQVEKGEVIATAVGLTGNGPGGTGHVNTFLDWGVYDYRQKNEASKDPAWAASHTSDTYQYGVCWFNWISAEHREKVLALPSSDGISGTQSDYCK